MQNLTSLSAHDPYPIDGVKSRDTNTNDFLRLLVEEVGIINPVSLANIYQGLQNLVEKEVSKAVEIERQHLFHLYSEEL